MKNRPIPRGPLLLMAGLVLLAAALAGVLYGKFDYSELCPVCGRARDVVDWQIPGTERTYYSIRHERETSLSSMLTMENLIEEHEHSWQFVRGEGNGRSIVMGSGHLIVWSMHSPDMGEFVRTMLSQTDQPTTLRWLNQLRNPRYSRLCRAMAEAARKETFANREEWETWLQDFELSHDQLVLQSETGP